MRTCPKCGAQVPDAVTQCPNDGVQLFEPEPAPAGEQEFLGAMIEGRYRIEAKLGEGAMGAVYAARHLMIDKRVAIKKLLGTDPIAAKRFTIEAKTVSKIHHPNVVDITDFGNFPDGQPCFVMEFLEGKTLGKVIREEQPLSDERITRLTMQIARGLAAAHVEGIVHRDLKPENIFIIGRDDREQVKIVDFGIAQVVSGEPGKPRLTQAGMVLGTVEYMAPEQALGRDTDHRLDQYSLGCVMYEMLTGDIPFRGSTATETMTKHAFSALVRPSAKRPDRQISPALEAIIVKAMSKEPDDRYTVMNQMLAALEDALTQITSGRDSQKAMVRASEREQATQQVGAIGPRRRRWAALGGGALLLAGLLGGGLWWMLRAPTVAPQPGVARGEEAPKVVVPPVAAPAPTPAPAAAPAPAAERQVTLKLQTIPAGAEVLLENVRIGVSPMEHKMDASSKPLTLSFSLRGYKGTTRRILPDADQLIEVQLEQRREKAAEARPPKGKEDTAAGLGLKTPW